MSAIRTHSPDLVDDVLDAHGGDARAAIADLLGRLDDARQACSSGYSRRSIVGPALRAWNWKPLERDVDSYRR